MKKSIKNESVKNTDNEQKSVELQEDIKNEDCQEYKEECIVKMYEPCKDVFDLSDNVLKVLSDEGNIYASMVYSVLGYSFELPKLMKPQYKSLVSDCLAYLANHLPSEAEVSFHSGMKDESETLTDALLKCFDPYIQPRSSARSMIEAEDLICRTWRLYHGLGR